MWNGNGPANNVEWPPPPELIIVHYLAGAVVNIHATGHSLPSKYAQISQLMESVEATVSAGGRGCRMSEYWGYFTIWKVTATPLCLNLQVHKGSTQKSKLMGRKFGGVPSKSALRPKARPGIFFILIFQPSFIYQIRHTEVAPGCLCKNCRQITIHQGNFNIFQTRSREEKKMAAAPIKAPLQI